jgi:hypothetical protein
MILPWVPFKVDNGKRPTLVDLDCTRQERAKTDEEFSARCSTLHGCLVVFEKLSSLKIPLQQS